MAIRFYNTLTRRIEDFSPLKEGEVRMYTCGPTVYDFAHIGNYRTYMFEDLLRRYLKYKGYKVIQVMNITDVDDKTIKGAREEGIELDDYTAKYKKAFFEDIDTLRIERAEHYPEATKHIDVMVELIKKLIDKGYGYRGEDGSYYYRVTKFDNYGKLSGKRLDKLQTTERMKRDEYSKEEIYDFALWKAWDQEDGDVFWETELGKGRPGWHIECSAMSMNYLGESFDIHTGGIDNIFPHHENEIAQSEGGTGKRCVKYWLHSAHLIVEGKKMSKSLGNFYTLRDILERGYSARAIRLLLLSTHYRQTLNFTFAELEAAQNNCEKFAEFLHSIQHFADQALKPNPAFKKIVNESLTGFENSLDDDLNISAALGFIFTGMRKINTILRGSGISVDDAEMVKGFMNKINTVLDVLPEEMTVPQEIVALVREREDARKNKDYQKADEIRDLLQTKGYIIEDTPKGTLFRKRMGSGK